MDAPSPGLTPPPATAARPVEELANAITHGAGALAALVAGSVLVVLASMSGDGWRLASAVVFGASLFALYLASTLYHAAIGPVAKARLKVVDHCAIYVLIAGTYTPFTLLALRGTWGWSLFTAIWALAAVGIVFKLFYTGRFKRASTLVYVLMGWMAITAIGPLMRALDSATLGWLVAGGIAYTLGTVFYLRAARFSHAVWHLFCVAGSACHYIAVLRVIVA